MKRALGSLSILLASAGASHAQEIDLADIFLGRGDPQTNEFLNMIFGPLFPVSDELAGAEETLVSSLIGNFNVLFFAIGALLFVYNVVVAVTETAHDGSAFGNRHSSLWAPLRTLLAAALLIPVAHGYNGVQYGIAYVVNAGTATASFFWDEAVDGIIADRMPVAAPDYVSQDAQFIQALYRMEICMAAYNVEVGKGGDLEEMMSGWVANRSPAVYLYSLSGSQGACGKITLPGESGGFERVATAAGTTYADWEAGMKSAISAMQLEIGSRARTVAGEATARRPLPEPANLDGLLTQWRQAHQAIMAPLVQKTNELASQAAEEALTETGVRAGTMDTGLAANLKNGGWSQAGFYYQLIARFSADAAAVQRMMPEMTPGDAIGASANPLGQTFSSVRTQMGSSWNPFNDGSSVAKEFLSEIANTYNITVGWWNESVARSGIRAFTNEQQAFADTGGDMSNYMPSAGDMFHYFKFLNPVNGDGDPMIALVTLGNGLASACVAALAGLGVLAAIPLVGNSILFIGQVLGWIISGTALAGAFLAFILPMVPTVMWVIAVSAFFLLVVEAIFAGPLWAIAHLTMDNEGMSGRAARRGYTMVLALFLTPLLMLMGFIVGMVIFRITGTLINGGFYYALTSAQSLSADSWLSPIWFIGIFVVILFLGFVYVIILERSFSLIAEFPGRMFRWFDNIGDDLDSKSAERTRVAALGTASATGQAGRALGSKGQGALSGPKAGGGAEPKQIGRDA
ncbi:MULTISPECIES: DotA/TraY family protein [unclassified Aurantimonas]|uniref:DotA/TraY family protein n=1 Tax=unclassified Aurantimonas TaxID=2638230 RepID=UPI002E18EBFB|nr:MULTISPECIES: DotA/TraY family protein [unclassified Aurantimonas]MEC5291931.1 DotA/TraY family protein [Aurantimonas sp. C2-3-R2]MEC5413017.1 DotA/TraY family protein [Aurantimonas sp. C2-4-R8]